MPELIFREATDNDMYDVMDIRNSGREYMTNDTSLITPEQQYDWWMTKDANRYRIWLVTSPNLDLIYDNIVNALKFTKTGEEIIIGFCMIRYMDNGLFWGTLAVYPDWQGVGYGTMIYEFLIQQAEQIWLEIRADNIASLRAAQKAGFKIYAYTKKAVILHS